MNVRVGIGILLCELKLYTLQPEMVEVQASAKRSGNVKNLL
jgi:hypothetical protein